MLYESSPISILNIAYEHTYTPLLILFNQCAPSSGLHCARAHTHARTPGCQNLSSSSGARVRDILELQKFSAHMGRRRCRRCRCANTSHYIRTHTRRVDTRIRNIYTNMCVKYITPDIEIQIVAGLLLLLLCDVLKPRTRHSIAAVISPNAYTYSIYRVLEHTRTRGTTMARHHRRDALVYSLQYIL